MDRADLWAAGLAAVLVVVASFVVTLETAIGRVSPARAEEYRRDGRRGARRLAQVAADRARHVNVLLFLHTLLAVAATALVTFACLDGSTWPVAWSVLLAVAVMVGVSYVVLGVAARTLGRQHADSVALRGAGLARVLVVLVGPLATGLIHLGNAVTPGRGFREGPFATAAELRELVDQAEADQVIADDERQMIHSVFELGDTLAREVMVPRTEMVTIERYKTLRQAMSLGLRSGFSRIPVVGDGVDDVVGIAYLKDVTRRTFEHHDAGQTERVESLMRPATFVPDTKRADDLLREMQAQRVHMVVAVDEYGGTAGLVTIEDILEEIVGQITDEYDTETPEVEALPGGDYRVSARLQVEDLAELLGWSSDPDTEDVETVGGLLAKRMGRVPIPGATLRVEGWALTAERGAGRRNRVATVLARRPEGTGPQE